MGSPSRLRMLKSRSKKAPLPNAKHPPLVVQGVSPSRIIRLPRYTKTGKLDGAVLIVRQRKRDKLRKLGRKVKTKIKRTKKSVA